MGKTISLHVGDSLEAVGERFVDAWHRAQKGELHGGNAEIHLGFASLEGMARVLSPKRLEVLRLIHRRPAHTVGQLAAALRREEREVSDDVAELAGAGLVEINGTELRAEYDAVNVRFAIAL